MNKNQELHELLGKCWHEPSGALSHIETGEKRYYCGKCCAWYVKGNPDYADDPRLVLEAMKYASNFQAWLDSMVLHELPRLGMIKVDLILDKTGRLRDMAIEFLRREK